MKYYFHEVIIPATIIAHSEILSQFAPKYFFLVEKGTVFNYMAETWKQFNPLSVNRTKCSNTQPQPTNCLSLFDHFVVLALKI